MSKFLQILAILNNILEPNVVQRQSPFKVYSILAVPSLLYDCDMWTLKQRDIRRQRQ